MIKKILQKTVLGVAVLSSSVMADYSDYMYDGYSLVGVEGGYNSLSAEMVDPDGVLNAQSFNDNAYHIGLKIGAQTGHYRIFLSARMYQDADESLEYLTTYGIEGQYLFNMFNSVDFFIGAGGGIINTKFLPKDDLTTPRTINDPYFSGEMGFNIHMTPWVDLELGGRYMSVDAVNSQPDKPNYYFHDMMTGYASIIFKYKMD